jgi:acyl dehydratase
MPDRYWESYEIGETWESHGRTVTEADIVNFAGISGDFHPASMDEQFVKTHTPYGRRIAHGALLFSISMGIAWQMKMNTKNITYGIDRVRFPKPTFIGDTIRLTGRVTVKEAYPKLPRYGVVVMHYEATSQDGKCVFACDHKMLIERESPSNSA